MLTIGANGKKFVDIFSVIILKNKFIPTENEDQKNNRWKSYWTHKIKHRKNKENLKALQSNTTKS